MPRLFTALQQARDSVRGAASGFHGQQRITLSDGITPSRLPTLLALSWQEEPDVELRLFEVSLSQQIKGLHGDLYDLGPSLVKWVPSGQPLRLFVEQFEMFTRDACGLGGHRRIDKHHWTLQTPFAGETM